MSEIEIKSLFDETRFPNGWKLLSLLLYSPLGLVLLVFRFLLSLQLWLLATIFPDCESLRTFLNHALSLVFGIIVNVEYQEKTPNPLENAETSPRIIATNSVSALDHFALRRISKTVAPSVWEIPTALGNAMGLQTMDTSNKDTLVASIKNFLQSPGGYNVHVQPEFAATNNRVALLKFRSWPFGIRTSVQPIAIKARRPELVDLRMTSLASTWWSDVLCFMFVPYTIFTLTFLEVKVNEDQEALAREVEGDIAKCLSVERSRYSVLDKKEYEKRYFAEKMRSSGSLMQNRQFRNSNSAGTSAEMQRMVRQVREVLPFVPRNVILKDLLKTRNVDVTIANILDGIVTYTPEPESSIIMPQCSTSSNSCQKSTIKGNDSASTSTLSFQKRKAMMIAEAREKYIKKHNLENC